MEIDRSDLEKISDALMAAHDHHTDRDKANAGLHLAHEVRYSPLTSMLGAEVDRCKRLLSRPVTS